MTPEQVQELAGKIGVTAEAEVGGLQRLINAEGTFYRALRSDKAASKTKSVREELDQLTTMLDNAIAILEDTHGNTHARLLGAMANMPLPSPAFIADDSEPFTRLDPEGDLRKCLMYMGRLRDASELAHDSMPSGAGRPRLDELRYLCAQLVEFYEDFSGESFTYDAQHVEGRLSGFCSRGAQWVQEVVKLIDPEVTLEHLGTVMRELTRSRRRPPW